MLQTRKINEQIAVSPQIIVADVAEIAAAGYQAIICNRPDNEDVGQPGFAEIEAAAQEHGVQVRWQPIIPGHLQDEHVQEFGKLLNELQGPVVAYCRSGGRSITLWALSQAGNSSVDEIIRDARAAGYDLAGLKPRLEATASSAET